VLRAAVVLALAITLAGCAATASSPSSPSSPPPAPAAGFESIELGGMGNDVARISIPDGAPAIVAFRHPDDAAFTVDKLAADGAGLGRLVDAPGRYAGTVMLVEPAGGSVDALRVTTTGTWSATIEPLSAARSWDGVGKLDGTGDDVVRVEPPLVGVTPWHIEHKGSSGFVVVTYAADGATTVLDETGAGEGDVRVVGGTYLMTVRGDGAWAFYVLM
jgi:hypothetical protein